MQYRVEAEGEVIGQSELEKSDASARLAFGRFHPGPAYERVRSVFRVFATALTTGLVDGGHLLLQDYQRRRDALRLRLLDQNGQVVRTTLIHVSDFAVGGEEDALELEVETDDEAFWASRARGEA